MAIPRNLSIGVLALAALAQAADPTLLDLIMPDARVVFGIDIGRMRSSPFHSSLASGMQSANPELRKLMEAAGFDPLRDLEEILAASTGTGKNPPALLVARGNFDTARLRAFAQLAGSKKVDFHGVEILTDPEKESGAFALLDNSLILAGNLDQVQAAITRRGRGVVLNSELATKISAMGRRYDLWLVSIAPLAPLAANMGDANVQGFAGMDALKAIEQFSLGIAVSSDVAMGAEVTMKNEKAASGLAESVQMLLAMAEKNMKEDPAAADALKSLDFGVDGRVIHLGFKIPAAEVEKAIQKAMNQSVERAGSMTAARQPRPPAAPPAILQSPGQPAVGQAPPAAARPAPPAPPAPVAGTPRMPPNTEIMIQSSPKDMGTVVIVGGPKK